MSLTQKQLIRIAGCICDQLLTLKQSKQRQVNYKVASLMEQMNRLPVIQRKLYHCEIRKWQAAGEKVLEQLEAVLRDIPYYTQQIEEAIQACSFKTPSVAEVYLELLQAEEEFGELEYRSSEDQLVVTTEPIELENVYLGAFEIQLDIPGLAEMRYNSIYRIVALDPHPPASNDSVTHPHVSDDHLCPGDAGAAINTSLVTGRICDFFLLVRSVLTNYNSESPYVSLNSWHGTPCYDCGWIMDDDDGYFCQFCENVFCGECSDYCRRCHEGACRGCLTECPVCGNLTCPDCMTECPDCGEPLCKTCLEDQACPCLEEDKENEDEESIATNETGNESKEFDVIREAARATETTVNIDAA